ncbi:MAG: gluconate 2-dehydrogenase subunit 3 family protein [Chitinophagaceae bacterium]
MNRRALIKNLLIVTGGVLVLPACVQEKSKAGILLKNMQVSAEEEALLAEVSETILPATNAPGAKDLYTHLFALKMLDDLSSKEEQQTFLKGLNALDKYSRQKGNKTFTEATPAEREKILLAIEKGDDVPEDLSAFYKKLKGLTVQAYVTSKYYLTEEQPYQLVPGNFKGCVPVKPSNKKAYTV